MGMPCALEPCALITRLAEPVLDGLAMNETRAVAFALLGFLAPLGTSGAWAADTDCPLGVGENWIRGSFLAGRVEFDLFADNATVESGWGVMGEDLHALVPAVGWRERVTWRVDGKVAAMMVFEDLVLLAADEIEPIAKTTAGMRFGQDFVDAAAVTPLTAGPRVTRAVVMEGTREEGDWGAAATLVLGDQTLVHAAIWLEQSRAQDETCRELARSALRSVGAGMRAPDAAGQLVSFRLPTGGELELTVPDGFTTYVQVNPERWTLGLMEWVTPDRIDDRDYVVFGVSVLEWERAPKGRGASVATSRVLGKRARWTASSNGDAEVTWVPGWLYGRRSGVIRVEVRAKTAERRRDLRGVAEGAALITDPVAPDEDTTL